MSRGITLTLLAAATLTACVCAVPWGRRPPPDRTWHDAAGNPVAEQWKTDETGKRVPDPHPHDRYGRPWVYDADGNLVPPPPPAGSTSRSYAPVWIWGGTGYRSFGGPSPSRAPSSGSTTRTGPSSTTRTGPSVSRGGFGSTGASGGA